MNSAIGKRARIISYILTLVYFASYCTRINFTVMLVKIGSDMMPELMQAAGVTEALKETDPMKWTGLMNNCKAQAEETILNELVFN